MQVKKVFNVEYDLTSEEFKSQKQDDVSEKCQSMHTGMICKITTFCVKDKQLVVSTTEENRAFMGASDKLLAHRPLAEQSFLNMDDDMVKTFEITITADTDLEDYVTAIDLAQAKADEMFEADDSKLPLVTVVDYRWGNVPATLTATVFSDVDADGNPIPLVGGTDSSANVVIGDLENGNLYLNNNVISNKSADYNPFNNGATLVSSENHDDRDGVNWTLESILNNIKSEWQDWVGGNYFGQFQSTYDDMKPMIDIVDAGKGNRFKINTITTTYCSDGTPTDPFEFFVSEDGENWTSAYKQDTYLLEDKVHNTNLNSRFIKLVITPSGEVDNYARMYLVFDPDNQLNSKDVVDCCFITPKN